MSREAGWAPALLPSRGCVISRQGLVIKLGLANETDQIRTLTNQEIEELDAFLLSDDGLENAMDVSSLDGFLCAVLSGPNVIMPSEWMRWVWDSSGRQTVSGVYEREAGATHP